MISFVDVEGAADETAAEERVSIEAAESNNRALYERALRLQGDGRDGEAATCYEELLAQPLIVAAAPVPGLRAPPPSLRLKSLALKNLGTILQRRGEAARALDRLLAALQLSADGGGDGVLWQRVGSLAAEVGKPHLARHALEMSVAASAHNQLARFCPPRRPRPPRR